MRCTPTRIGLFVPSICVAAACISTSVNGPLPEAEKPLSVLHVRPESPVDWSAPVVMTFDRPVAPRLGESVDADAVLDITPPLEADLWWRDPASMVVVPRLFWESDQEYSLTLRPGLRAADGAVLSDTVVRSFHTAPPAVLTTHVPPDQVGPRAHVQVLVDAEVPLARISERSRIRGSGTAACGPRESELRPVRVRDVSPDDPPRFDYQMTRISGQLRRDPRAERRTALARVMEFVSDEPLGRDCSYQLYVPRRLPALADTTVSLDDRDQWIVARMALRPTPGISRSRCLPQSGCSVVFRTEVERSVVGSSLRLVGPRGPLVGPTDDDSRPRGFRWTTDQPLNAGDTVHLTVLEGLVDAHGQAVEAGTSRTLIVEAYPTAVDWPAARYLASRRGSDYVVPVEFRSTAGIRIERILVPDSLELQFLRTARDWYRDWERHGGRLTATVLPVPYSNSRIQDAELPIIARDDRRESSTLHLVRISAVDAAEGELDEPALRRDSTVVPLANRPQTDQPDDGENPRARVVRAFPLAVVQTTDLAIHWLAGVDQMTVWVTDAVSGRPRMGADVRVMGPNGELRGRGRTDGQGTVVLGNLAWPRTCRGCPEGPSMQGEFEGYIVAATDDDRAVAAVVHPGWHDGSFGGVYSRSSTDRAPARVVMFTDRDLYRPGDSIFAKAIVRVGHQGDLALPGSDTIRWRLTDPRGEIVFDSVQPLGDFGTAELRTSTGRRAELGHHVLQAELSRNGEWRPLSTSWFSVDEYRPPEFRLEVSRDSARTYVAQEPVEMEVEGRYLFDAPMEGADVAWTISESSGAYVGWLMSDRRGWSVGGWSGFVRDPIVTEVAGSLDSLGRHVVVGQPAGQPDGLPRTMRFEVAVTDANRQVRQSRASAVLHPASLYPAVKVNAFWMELNVGKPSDFEVVAIDLEGNEVSGIEISGHLIADVPPVRPGPPDRTAAPDTVDTCTVRTGAEPALCTVTPTKAGSLWMDVRLRDSAGRMALTRIRGTATARDRTAESPSDSMAVRLVLDKSAYEVQDTAEVQIESPFRAGYALVTVQQERVLEVVQVPVSEGPNTVRIPVREAFYPQSRVSVMLVEARDGMGSGHARIRLGYGSLTVRADDRRLKIAVVPDTTHYGPGETVRFDVSVRGADSIGRRSEVALWATDEGVLSMTGFQTPDVMERMYFIRNGSAIVPGSNLIPVSSDAGIRLSSEALMLNPLTVGNIPPPPTDEPAVRTDFRSTAFFVGSVVTDRDGRATVDARLPDNLTTYRVMAVAVDDRHGFGSADTSIVVDRRLMARPALPRFVRPDDEIEAGVVLNSKMESSVSVEVELEPEGLDLRSDAVRIAQVEPNRPEDVRFRMLAQDRDTVQFEFHAHGGGEADAVRVGLPVGPRASPLARTAAGSLRESESIELELDANVDLATSQLEIGFGSSPLSFVEGIKKRLDLYPYRCSEQIASHLLAAVAVYRGLGDAQSGEAERIAQQIAEAVGTLLERQRADGGIGYWSRQRSFSSPIVTAYAGRALLEAANAGFLLPDSVMEGIGDYLENRIADYLRGPSDTVENPGDSDDDDTPDDDWVTRSIDDLRSRWKWGERAVSVELLSRLGRPSREAEDALLMDIRHLEWTDRLHLTRAFLRRGDGDTGRRMLDELLVGSRIDGRTLVLPESASRRPYGPFRSRVAPVATMLSTLLEADPGHRFIGPAVERLVAQSRTVSSARGGVFSAWTTFDAGQAALALAQYHERVQPSGSSTVRVDLPGGTLNLTARAVSKDTLISLTSELAGSDGTVRRLPLQLRATDQGPPIFFYATLRGTPSEELPDPADDGILVERWYEDVATGRALVQAVEGDVIRVRIRVTVPEERTFVVIEDPLPAGLEIVASEWRHPFGWRWWRHAGRGQLRGARSWIWDLPGQSVWLSPWAHRAMYDDRAVFSAIYLWPGSYDLEYLTRATTAGRYLYPPAYAEEMYNPGVRGRSAGGHFTVLKQSEG